VNRSFFLCLAACRMRSSACDTLSRFCARHVICWSTFPLAPALRSVGSAANRSALFADFPTAPRLPDADQTALPRLVKRGISRFPPKKLPHMPGSSTTPGCPDARADASVHVAFRLRNSVGAQDMNLCEAQLLAYAFPYRRFAAALAGVRARLRVDADRYSLIVSDFHRLLLAGLSGALRKIPDVILLKKLC
jgi:hypothetical protein